MLTSREIYNRYCAVVDAGAKTTAVKNDRQKQWSEAKKWAAAALKVINEKDDWRVSFPKFLKELFAKTAEQKRAEFRCLRSEKTAQDLRWVSGKGDVKRVYDPFGRTGVDGPFASGTSLTTNVPDTPMQYNDFEIAKQNKWKNPFTWRLWNGGFARSQDAVVKARAQRISQQMPPKMKVFVNEVQKNHPNFRPQFDANGVSGRPYTNRINGYFNSRALGTDSPEIHIGANELIGEHPEKYDGKDSPFSNLPHEYTHGLHWARNPEAYDKLTPHQLETMARIGQLRGEAEFGVSKDWSKIGPEEYPLDVDKSRQYSQKEREDFRNDLYNAALPAKGRQSFSGTFSELNQVSQEFDNIWNKK